MNTNATACVGDGWKTFDGASGQKGVMLNGDRAPGRVYVTGIVFFFVFFCFYFLFFLLQEHANINV